MRNLFDAESLRTAAKGVVGMSASGGGFYVSILPKVEAWLRIASLLIGCTVGIATLISILRKRKSKPNDPMKKTKLKLFLLILVAIIAMAFTVTLFAQDASAASPDTSASATSFIAGIAARYPVLITVLTVIGILRVLFKPVMSAIEAAVANNPSKAKALQDFESGPIFKALSWVLDFGASIKLKPLITNSSTPPGQ